MTNNYLVSIRPDYELATRYGAAWLMQILNAATNKGLPFTDLYKSQATRSNFFSEINANDPALVHIFGHGNYTQIACQNNELLLQAGVNDDILANRIVYDLSCEAGRDLGPSAVSKGAISFLGYNEDFIFIVSDGSHPDGGMTNPTQDEAARGFFESHNAAPISYIQKKNLARSFTDSQNSFNYWIDVWKSIDANVVSLLVWDRDHQVIIPTPSPSGGGFPLLLMFAGLMFFIPVITKNLKRMKPL